MSPRPQCEDRRPSQRPYAPRTWRLPLQRPSDKCDPRPYGPNAQGGHVHRSRRRSQVTWIARPLPVTECPASFSAGILRLGLTGQASSPQLLIFSPSFLRRIRSGTIAVEKGGEGCIPLFPIVIVANSALLFFLSPSVRQLCHSRYCKSITAFGLLRSRKVRL